MSLVFARPMHPRDVDRCVQLLRAGGVHPGLLQASLLRQWLRDGRLVARVFEEVVGTAPVGRLRGCGLSVPVPLDWAQRACAGAVSPLVEALLDDPLRLTLDRRAQARALGEHAMCMFVLGFGLDDEAGAAMDVVNAVAQAAFVQAHAGYGLRYLIGEVAAHHPQARAYRASMLAMGCRRAPLPRTAATEVLYLADHHLADAPYHALYGLFRYQPRRWGFTPAQQALLELALAGLDDAQVAQHLGLSRHTVHKRWRAIYALVDDDPGAWAMLGLSSTRATVRACRGLEKRRHLLDYVRIHPEELRPWPATAPCLQERDPFWGLRLGHEVS
ncbi:hypothetical protein [Caldimonas sp.]|uniref:hypothetical protein n=1 Tax=Caldimonas sp. TaxID=2838790 RepID=UPI00391938C5